MSEGTPNKNTSALSIQASLLLAFLAISSVLAAALSIASLISGYRNGLSQATEHLISVAGMKEFQLTAWSDSLANGLEGVLPQGPLFDAATELLNQPPESPATSALSIRLSRHFEESTRVFGNFQEICLLDTSGQVLASSRQDGECSFGQLPKQQSRYALTAKTTLWFRPDFSDMIIATRPIVSGKGVILGTLAGGASPNQVEALMAGRSGLSKTGATLLLSSTRIHVAPSQAKGAATLPQYDSSQGIPQLTLGRYNGQGVYTGAHGRMVIGIWRWLPALDAVLLAEQDLTEALEPVYASLLVNLATAAACMLLTILAARWLSRRMATPLAGLAEAAGRVAKGQMDFRVPVCGQAEVRALAESFNLMTERLNKRTGVETLLGELARMLLSAPHGAENATIDAVLERLGRFCDAESVTLSTTGPDGEPIATHHWPGGLPPGRAAPCALNGVDGPANPEGGLWQPIVRPGLSGNNETASDSPRGAFAWSPLHKNLKPWGFLCMEALTPRPWDDGDLRLLSLAGEILSMGLERVSAQKAQAQAESSYRSLFDNAAEAILQTTPEGRVLTANPAAARMFGYDSPDDMTVMTTDILAHHFAHPARRNELLELLRADRQVRNFEILLSPKSGRLTWVSVNARSIFDDAGELFRLDLMAEDITAHKASEAEREQLLLTLAQKNVELAKAQSATINVIDSMPSALVSVDENQRITQINLEAARRAGCAREAALGRPLDEALPQLAQLKDDVAKAIHLRTPVVHRHQPLTGAETGRYSDTVIYPLLEGPARGAVLRVDDVTERVRVEEMMVQTEKMLSVGGLAAGMAHEINNPLAGILQSAQNILRRLSPGLEANRKAATAAGCELEAIQAYLDAREIPAFLEGIKSSGERAARIVSNMLEFSNRSTSSKVPVDLHAVLEQALELASSDYDLTANFDFKNITIVRDFDPAFPLTPCSASQIQQVMLNLLRNAAQALTETSGSGHKPRITLRTRAEAGSIRIDLADNGPGMNEETKRRAFEPFFTTKAVGQGTGLGLSVSYFLITQNHKGELLVKSQPGQGTVFTIRLPLQPEASQ